MDLFNSGKFGFSFSNLNWVLFIPILICQEGELKFERLTDYYFNMLKFCR
jgi:hypothetical protein